MNDILHKLKLRTDLVAEIDINKKDFIEKFKSVFENSSLSFFSIFFKSFFPKKTDRELIGYLQNDTFKLKRNASFNTFNPAYATAKGEFIEKDDKLIVNIQINGFNNGIMPLYILFGILSPILILGPLNIGNELKSDIIFSLINLIFCVFIFGTPYYLMRKDAKTLKQILEKEFGIMN